jgi:hypothetical protein
MTHFITKETGQTRAGRGYPLIKNSQFAVLLSF